MTVKRSNIAVAALAVLCAAAAYGFVNDICLPSQLWMLPETQNNVFVQPLIKRWRPYNDFVRFSADRQCHFLRRLNRVATIDKPVDGATLTVELVNGDEFETVKKVKSGLRPSGISSVSQKCPWDLKDRSHAYSNRPAVQGIAAAVRQQDCIHAKCSRRAEDRPYIGGVDDLFQNSDS